jgi:hypothetical protein
VTEIPIPASVRRDLDELRSELTELREAHQWNRYPFEQAHHPLDEVLDQRFTQFQYDILEPRLAELAETHQSSQARAAQQQEELVSQLRALHATVRWLRRQITRARDLTPVTLDDPDAQMRQWAGQVERRYAAEAAELGFMERQQAGFAIKDHARKRDAEHAAYTALVARLQEVAGTRLNSPKHWDAVDGVDADWKAYSAARTARRNAQSAADKARVMLDQEQQRAATAAPVIETGKTAWAELYRRIRQHLTAVLAADQMLPVWFTTVLGDAAPADHTQAWIDTATQLIAYRITYHIDDPVVALGPAPQQGHSRRRHHWHTSLATGIARYGLGTPH